MAVLSSRNVVVVRHTLDEMDSTTQTNRLLIGNNIDFKINLEQTIEQFSTNKNTIAIIYGS